MIYLQRYSETGQLGKEEKCVMQHCIMEGLDYRVIEQESIVSGMSPPKDISLFVGSIEATRIVLESLGCCLPEPDYYPDALRDHLGRKVWRGDVHQLIYTMAIGSEVFAKPQSWKLFTGQIFNQEMGYSICSELSAGEKLWLSDIVEFQSEFRCYVTNWNLVAVCQYGEGADAHLDQAKIEAAIDLLKGSGYPTTTFAFDWGLVDGKTLLIEMNHCFSIGQYNGITPQEYFKFLQAGWSYLTE